MTDPNLPPVTPPAATQPPIYQPPAAPAYAAPAAPAAPAYGQKNPAYPEPYAQPAGPDKYNVLSIVSLVSAFFISLVAIVTGHIALNQIGKTGEKGRGLAIAGVVLGYLGVLATIIFVIVWFTVFAAAINDGRITGY